MKITIEEMNEIHRVQKDLFATFCNVCDELELCYFMVHGSLLGAVQKQGFYPFDDDIDVAMPRADYDVLLSKGQQYLPDYYFLQAHETENCFPLPFAKLRDSRTSFIQPILRNINVNMGIYIDIFPIDSYPKGYFAQKALYFKEKAMSFRINADLERQNKISNLKKVLFSISKILMPSWEKTVYARVKLHSKHKMSEMLIITGAKTSERGIPEKWFSSYTSMKFEGKQVRCPVAYDKYLSRIYGDYKNYNPAVKNMNGNDAVEISAEFYSTTEPYSQYIRQ